MVDRCGLQLGPLLPPQDQGLAERNLEDELLLRHPQGRHDRPGSLRAKGGGQDEGCDCEEEESFDQRHVLRVRRSALRPEGQAACPEREALDGQGPLRDELARQRRDRQRQGLIPWAGKSRLLRPTLPPCRPPLLCGESRSGSPPSWRTTTSTSRPRREKCTPSWVRTAPVRRPCPTSSPASIGRTKARSCRPAGGLPLAARRDRGGDRDGAPALPPRVALHCRRERRSRRSTGRWPCVPLAIRRDRGTRRRAFTSVRPSRRPPRAHLAALGR